MPPDKFLNKSPSRLLSELRVYTTQKEQAKVSEAIRNMKENAEHVRKHPVRAVQGQPTILNTEQMSNIEEHDGRSLEGL